MDLEIGSLYEFFLNVAKRSGTHSSHDGDTLKTLSLYAEGLKNKTKSQLVIVYRIVDDRLYYEYVASEKIDPTAINQYLYEDFSLSLDAPSPIPYSVRVRKVLNIPDVHNLPEDSEFAFNDHFKVKFGYVSVSSLIIPIFSHKGHPLGALLLSNREAEDGTIIPYSERDSSEAILGVSPLANLLSTMDTVSDIMIEFLKLVELRDPSETGKHIQRVGMLAEIVYGEYSRRRNYDFTLSKMNRRLLRSAAMFHDVGKVGIPDGILTKPGKLTDDEISVMRGHTLMGRWVFEGCREEVAKMALNVAVCHHQRWDGEGYPELNINGRKRRLKGEEIPLEARITSLVDVFDALYSVRVYKPRFPLEKCLAIIKEERGCAFDPELVDIFFSLLEEVKDVYSDLGVDNEELTEDDFLSIDFSIKGLL